MKNRQPHQPYLPHHRHRRPVSILAITAMVLALTVGVGVPTAAADSGCDPFPDVTSSNPHCDNIAWLKGKDITKPADGLYHPGASVNRGAMAAFLFRLTHPGKPSPTCRTKPFPDVATTNVFCGYIQWAADNGIAYGYPDGTYGPDSAVTRGAMAAYLHRIARPGAGATPCTVKPFTDVSDTETFCGVITWMVDYGITYGIGDGLAYGTTLPVTRQAMASFLHRISTWRHEAASGSSAAVARPLLRLMPGDATITVAWQAMRGATGYEVRYSTSKSMANAVAKPRSGSARWTTLPGLTNGETYYVQVVARGSFGTRASTVRAVRPEAGYPRELTVTAEPAGPNQIRVHWTGQERATKVAVIAGSNSATTEHAFNSPIYPATATTITLTVPKKYRAELGTGSGNPVFVKVATYNSRSAGSSLPRTKNVGAAYRLSLAGTYSDAGYATPHGTKIRVAEWNVQSVSASANIPGESWAQRRHRVAAGIVASGADVVTTAELTGENAGVGGDTTQWEDLAALLKPQGYVIAHDPGRTPKNSTKGTHVFYKPSVMTPLDGGTISPRSLGVAWPSGLVTRYLSWAKFRLNSNRQVFYVVAVHFPPNTADTDYASLRTAEASALNRFISTRAGGHTVVVAGDFNSTWLANGNDPAITLRRAGFYDASATASRSNARISTANITHQVDNTAARGYPTKPYYYEYPAPRIDYIMVKNSPGSWQYTNQVILRGGSFDQRYQGSDHNLQWADIAIAR